MDTWLWPPRRDGAYIVFLLARRQTFVEVLEAVEKILCSFPPVIMSYPSADLLHNGLRLTGVDNRGGRGGRFSDFLHPGAEVGGRSVLGALLRFRPGLLLLAGFFYELCFSETVYPTSTHSRFSLLKNLFGRHFEEPAQSAVQGFSKPRMSNTRFG